MEEFSVKSTARTGFIDITSRVESAVAKSGVAEGIVTVYCPHTTAAITINENADPDVTRDMDMKLNKIIDRDPAFRHMEGNSDGHIKSSFVGASETLIIEGARLLLGTWQGIYLAEFDGPRRRTVYLKIIEG